MLVRVVWVNYSEVTQFNMAMELRFQCFDRKQHNTYLLIATNYVSQLGHVSSLDASTYVFLNFEIIFLPVCLGHFWSHFPGCLMFALTGIVSISEIEADPGAPGWVGLC